MKSDIELCAELLRLLLMSRGYAGAAPPEALSEFLHNFRLDEAYERAAAKETKLLRNPFKSFVDEQDIRGRLAELDRLIPMAAMVLGFRGMEEPRLKAHEDFKTLQQEISQLNTRLQKVDPVESNLEALSQRVKALEATVSALSQAPVLTRESARQRFTMLVIGAIAFGLTVIMIGYGFYWGYQHGKPDISIDLDIGQLVGGTLLGTGALLAGGAYALTTLRRLKGSD